MLRHYISISATTFVGISIPLTLSYAGGKVVILENKTPSEQGSFFFDHYTSAESDSLGLDDSLQIHGEAYVLSR